MLGKAGARIDNERVPIRHYLSVDDESLKDLRDPRSPFAPVRTMVYLMKT